uniref:Metalloendopeptidase n=1 Tax=Crassostrea virginica TaxID=6565 RepID=A0A8B8D283_CRAVI|nr:uncharacterized protein LOC111123092 isoform X1 [Crassostrea virginica]
MVTSSVFILFCGVLFLIDSSSSEKVVGNGRLNLRGPLKVHSKLWHNKKIENGRIRRHVIHISKKERYKNLIGHGGSVIDKKAYDPDSVIADILAGMFVKRNGIERTPHIDFQHSKRFRGQQLDTHKLTHKQKVKFGIESEKSKDIRKRKKRNFVKDDSQLWTNGIVPYTMDANLSNDTRDVLQHSIEIMNNLTCVRFVPDDSALARSVQHQNKVRFLNGVGCWSYVGMINYGTQGISLQDPGCISIGTAIHEMDHALGMWHEQNRGDRDTYIEVYGDNIRDGGLNNINYKLMDTRDTYPYDISSVLQYSFRAFAVDRSQPTMRSKDPRLAFLAGKATGLMFYDAKEITYVYNCTQNCANPPNCQNGGYVDQYCRCRCPPGLTGTLCTSVVSSPGCGGVLSLSPDGEATITSSNYPQNYNLGEECVWLVKAQSDKHIQMTIDFMDVSDNGYDTCYHWLEVRYNLMGQDGPELCGLRKAENYFTTPDEMKNAMILKFNSIISSDRPSSAGFHLTVRSIGTSCVDHPCKFGKCFVTSTSYRCQCQPGYGGTNCDEIVDNNMYLYANFDGTGISFLQNIPTDNFDWTLNSGGTPSTSTGPSSAHSGKYYMYIETSQPRSQGDKAILSSSIVKFPTAQERCLRFAYHMYGSDSMMGSLAVYFHSSSISKTLAFTKTGNQGNQWNQVEVNVPVLQNLQVSFEGVAGSGYLSDIAIDSVELRSHNCSSPRPPTITYTIEPTEIGTTASDNPTVDVTAEVTNLPSTSPQTSLPDKAFNASTTEPVTTLITNRYASSPMGSTTASDVSINSTALPSTTTQVSPPNKVTCGFESGQACFLRNLVKETIIQTEQGPMNLQSDDFDWITGQTGQTPSPQTGPSAAYKGSQYAFIEASSPRNYGDRAILKTGVVFKETTQCLSFSYHMFGDGAGQLNVYYSSSNGTMGRIFHKAGNQENAWKLETIEIPPTKGLQIYFEGICGTTYQSDIALDEAIVSEGLCANTTNGQSGVFQLFPVLVLIILSQLIAYFT